jgi:hypothetical protein
METTAGAARHEDDAAQANGLLRCTTAPPWSPTFFASRRRAWSSLTEMDYTLIAVTRQWDEKER